MASDEQMVADGAVGVAEAARFIGLSRMTLHRLMGRGALRYVKVGRRRLLPRAELRRLLAESVVQTQAG